MRRFSTHSKAEKVTFLV